MVPLSISTGVLKTQSVVDIDLRKCGNIFKIYSRETSQYAGIMNHSGLHKLVAWPAVQLRPRLMRSSLDPNPAISTRPTSTPYLIHVDCRILVYGLRVEGHDVAQALSDAGLYLQHPFSEEVDDDITYWNPHFLLRPGQAMPRLENLDLNEVTSKTPNRNLDEVEKCRLLHIFDSADGQTSVPDSTKPSSRLIPGLMR